MEKLYYLTFDKNLQKTICEIFADRKFIKIIKAYNDGILAKIDERNLSKMICFNSKYVVINLFEKQGVGSLNVAMKNLLENKNLKVSLPATVSEFKLNFYRENSKILLDQNLKRAVETRLRILTKKSISYKSEQAELAFFAKSDGQVLFVKKIKEEKEVTLASKGDEFEINECFLASYVSNPQEGETLLDPFSKNGMMPFVTAYCFKKSNMIACETDAKFIKEIKSKLKLLNKNKFSLLTRNFLDDDFPIKFIDKIIIRLPHEFTNDLNLEENYQSFFDKAFKLNVRNIVLIVDKWTNIDKFIKNKFVVDNEYNLKTNKIVKLKIRA